jgi:hypothetical protein
MLLSPMRRAPLMLGGVGFQVGLDETAKKRAAEAAAAAAAAAPRPAAPDLAAQLKELKAMQDAGALTPQEFEAAKRKVLGT